MATSSVAAADGIGGGRNFSLTFSRAMMEVLWEKRAIAHMYLNTHTDDRGAPLHTWGMSEFSFFGLVPWVLVAQCRSDSWLGTRTLSVGRELFVPVMASGINIFGTLPNWQGKLFVRRPANCVHRDDWELFAGPGPGCCC